MMHSQILFKLPWLSSPKYKVNMQEVDPMIMLGNSIGMPMHHLVADLA